MARSASPPARSVDAGAQRHELEELEAFDRGADEVADLLRAGELDHGVRDRVDAHRRVGEEHVVELGPRPARHRVGVRVLQAGDRDVVDRVLQLVRHGHLGQSAGREKSRLGCLGGIATSGTLHLLSRMSSNTCTMLRRSSS